MGPLVISLYYGIFGSPWRSVVTVVTIRDTRGGVRSVKIRGWERGFKLVLGHSRVLASLFLASAHDCAIIENKSMLDPRTVYH